MGRIPLILVPLLLAGCENGATAPAVDYALVTTVAPSVARVGDPVTVTVAVVNTSQRPQQFKTNACFTAFEVRDANGTPVAPRSGQPCFAYATTIVLQPGAQYSIVQEWSGEAIGSASSANVRPGDYAVVGNIVAGDRVAVIPAKIRLIQ